MPAADVSRQAVGVIAAALLAVGGLVLGVATAATARPPAQPVCDLDGFYARWRGLHGAYDPRASRPVRAWLALAYRAGAPLARRGLHPDLLTLWGGWLALGVLVLVLPGGRWPIAAAALLVASSFVDALDGCVAALTGRATRWGHVLDSVVDRVSDAAYVLAAWVAGAVAWLAVTVVAAPFLLEYVRARASAAGMAGIGAVTVGERPTRVICCAGALLSAGAAPAHATALASAWLAVLALLTLVGLAQLLAAVHRALA